MILSNIKQKLHKNSSSGRERWLWFAVLYVVSLAIMAAVMLSIHALIAFLINL